MAILLVTYDLKNPGRNYEPLHSLLKQYNYCKGDVAPVFPTPPYSQ